MAATSIPALFVSNASSAHGVMTAVATLNASVRHGRISPSVSQSPFHPCSQHERASTSRTCIFAKQAHDECDSGQCIECHCHANGVTHVQPCRPLDSKRTETSGPDLMLPCWTDLASSPFGGPRSSQTFTSIMLRTTTTTTITTSTSTVSTAFFWTELLLTWIVGDQHRLDKHQVKVRCVRLGIRGIDMLSAEPEGAAH